MMKLFSRSPIAASAFRSPTSHASLNDFTEWMRRVRERREAQGWGWPSRSIWWKCMADGFGSRANWARGRSSIFQCRYLIRKEPPSARRYKELERHALAGLDHL